MIINVASTVRDRNGNKKASNQGVDYTGKTVGEWTVLGLAKNTGSPRYQQIWTCVCSCGNRQEVDKGSVLSGHSKGCSLCVGIRHVGSKNPNWKGHEAIPGEVYYRILKCASRRGIEVSITILDIHNLWTASRGKCALSGLDITLGGTASLDRIDSKQAYTPDNIQWVNKTVNHMKNKYSEEIFVDICRRVAKHKQY